jgi:hypothetical protein
MAIVTDQNVLGWRREQLLAAGFPYDHAHALAVDSEVDLHKAIELAASAGHWLAYRILVASEPEPKRDHLERIKEYL